MARYQRIGKQYKHRFLLKEKLKGRDFQGKGSKYVVDHIDGNRYNNDLSNLRIITRIENTILNNKTISFRDGVYYKVCGICKETKRLDQFHTQNRNKKSGSVIYTRFYCLDHTHSEVQSRYLRNKS